MTNRAPWPTVEIPNGFTLDNAKVGNWPYSMAGLPQISQGTLCDRVDRNICLRPFCLAVP
jgi:hypothetical protein